MIFRVISLLQSKHARTRDRAAECEDRSTLCVGGAWGRVGDNRFSTGATVTGDRVAGDVQIANFCFRNISFHNYIKHF